MLSKLPVHKNHQASSLQVQRLVSHPQTFWIDVLRKQENLYFQPSPQGFLKIRLVWKTCSKLHVINHPQVTDLQTEFYLSPNSKPFSWLHASSLEWQVQLRFRRDGLHICLCFAYQLLWALRVRVVERTTCDEVQGLELQLCSLLALWPWASY